MCSHLHLDLTAESADPSMLPFMAPPDGAPPYHGFGLTTVTVDGFRLGAISDFLNDPAAAEGGDGFVEAPDGSRAGIVWKWEDDAYVFQTVEPTSDRWGVWLVGVPHRMTDLESARANFELIVPMLRPHWEAWRAG